MAPRFEDLKAEYADLWQRMEVRPDRVGSVNQIANRLIDFKSRYQSVSQATGVPWFVIAAIHNRESDANFSTYLGNGEPLNRVTRLVPRGRGPFASWEAGAIDALGVDGLDQIADWSIERACYAFEKFNGFGYRSHPPVKSPYLWSFSSIYQSGKFVADGHFNSSVVDQQCGTMPIIKQIIALDQSASFPAGIPSQVTTTSPLAMGSRGDRVTQLQTALRQRGYGVGDIDGIYGTMTRDAVTAFQRAAGVAATGVADEPTLRALAAAAPIPAPVDGSVTTPPLQPGDILRILLSELGKLAGSSATAAGSAPPVSSSVAAGTILQQILSAFLAKPIAPTLPGAGAMSAPTPQVVLTPIDKMLGGEALAGKKTALAIVAYVVMAILQAVGVVGAGTPAGIIVNTIIAAFGGLGGLSKIDRVIQTLGMIAAKRPG